MSHDPFVDVLCCTERYRRPATRLYYRMSDVMMCSVCHHACAARCLGSVFTQGSVDSLST